MINNYPLLNTSNPSYPFPDDVFSLILRRVTYLDLYSFAFVSHHLKTLVEKITPLSKLSIFNYFAFSPVQWNSFCGKNTVSNAEIEEAFESLQDDINFILKKVCPISAEVKHVSDTHMLFYIPKAIHQKIVSVNNFGIFLQKQVEFFDNPTGYAVVNDYSSINMQIGHGWVVMSKISLSDSEGQNCEEQYQSLQAFNEANSTHYRLPKIAEAVIGVYTHYFKTRKWLLDTSPIGHIRCEEPYGCSGSTVSYNHDLPCGLSINHCNITDAITVFPVYRPLKASYH